jgi:Protein of unknown function (DUF3489)
MPAKKLRARKNPPPKVSAQRPTNPRPSPRASTPERQAGHDEAPRSAATRKASVNRSDSNAECPEVSELPQGTERAPPPVPAFKRECAADQPKCADQDDPEAAKAATLQVEDQINVEPNSPSEPLATPGKAVDSLTASAPVEETKNPSESKQARVLTLLRSPGGATIAAMASTTGWQAHSVRGFLTSVVRQKLGLNLTSQKVDGERRYRIMRADPSSELSGGEPFSISSQPNMGLSPASPTKTAE